MKEMTFWDFLRAYNLQYKETSGLYHRLARHYGLSDCAFWILYTLQEEGRAMTQTELVGALFVSKQTVHSAVSLLEREGWLAPVPGGDRRSRAFTLTAKGSAMAERTVDQVFAMEERAFLRLSREERESILSLGQRYLDLLRAESGSILGEGEREEEK